MLSKNTVLPEKRSKRSLADIIVADILSRATQPRSYETHLYPNAGAISRKVAGQATGYDSIPRIPLQNSVLLENDRSGRSLVELSRDMSIVASPTRPNCAQALMRPQGSCWPGYGRPPDIENPLEEQHLAEERVEAIAHRHICRMACVISRAMSRAITSLL